jgi:hypothetical protein
MPVITGISNSLNFEISLLGLEGILYLNVLSFEEVTAPSIFTS